MTLEEKVGQLFTTYVYGPSADHADPRNTEQFGVDTPAEVVRKYHLGGVIYFAWADNLRDPRQIADLSNGLQRTAVGSGAGLPLLVGTDQEQGTVTRIGPPATQFPGSMALGAGALGATPGTAAAPADEARPADDAGRPARPPVATGDATLAADITGRELRAIGVNLNFAPDSDVNANPANPVIGVRSFGGDPALVAQLAAAQVRGFQGPGGRGVSATAEHFPGHGDTTVDSHTGLPVITHSRQRWEQRDAPPFRAAIRAGVDAIMSAHIVLPGLDPSGDPATLSAPILTGLLRDELGFRGVIYTDSLSMAGVRARYGDDRVPVLALRAGADALLTPPDLTTAYDSVLAAVRSGELSEQRIDQSVLRILALKWRRGIVTNPYVDADAVGLELGTRTHLAAAQQITDRTVTVVRNSPDSNPNTALLPLPGPPRWVLVTGWGAEQTAAVSGLLRSAGSRVSTLTTGAAPTPDRMSAAVRAAAGKNLIVVLTSNAATDLDQAELLARLASTGVPVVAIAVHNPYDVALPGPAAWLATYSPTAVSLQSAVNVMLRRVRPVGRLPVDIPAADGSGLAYRYGTGLSW
jgi:beta-N-acetylhexosaminidase